MKAALRWLLFGYILLLGCEEYFTGPGLTYALGVTLFGAFVLAMVRGDHRIRFGPAGATMVLLLLLSFVSILWSWDSPRTLYFAFMLLQLMLSTWIATLVIEDESHLRFLVWALILTSLYPSLSMVSEYLRHGIDTAALEEFGGRMSFGRSDPNLNAYRFVTSIVATLYMTLQVRRFWAKTALLAMAGLFMCASMLTGSRGGAIALVASGLVLMVFNFREHKRTILGVTACCLALFALALPRLPETITDRYLNIEQEVAHGTMALRKVIYKEAEVSFRRQPALGVGYFAFSSYSQAHGGLGKAAHNDGLEMIVDLGVAGFLLYLALMVQILAKAWTLPHPWGSLALSLVVAYAASSQSITLLAAKLPWVMFGVVLGAGAWARRAGRTPEVPA